MNSMKIEINFDDLVEDMFVDANHDEFGASPSYSFKEALQSDIVNKVSSKVISELNQKSSDEVTKLAKQTVSDFVSTELQGIILRKLRKGEIRTRYDGFKSFDELIEKHLDRMNIENVIERHVKAMSEQFAKDMRARYDNIFAAKVVQSLNNQKMLSDDVAKILLGDAE